MRPCTPAPLITSPPLSPPPPTPSPGPHSHYSANLMRLVVLGRHSLEELAALVGDAFAAVPSQGLAPPSFPPDLFTQQQLCCLTRVLPIKEGSVLTLAWPIPASEPHYRCTPTSLLSHLLGHEGSGSAFALLKERRWASALSAGESGAGCSAGGIFYCRIELTEAGHAAAEQVGASRMPCAAAV